MKKVIGLAVIKVIIANSGSGKAEIVKVVFHPDGKIKEAPD